MDRAERNKILGRKRGRKPEVWKLKKTSANKMKREKAHVQTARISAFL
jgi:hypothetical protein